MEPKSKLFSSREVRALLLLLPVLAVVSWLVWAVARPKIDESAAAADATGVTTNSGQHGANFGQGGADVALSEDQGSGDSTNGTAPPTERESTAGAPTSPKLFAFDPNTIDYHDLVRLGFTRGEALGIVKYRARGKVFEIPEDFAACYQVSEAMYLRLAPYIVIGEQYRLKPFAQRGSGSEGSSTTSVSRQSGSAPADVANIAPPTERESAAAAPLSRETRLENHNAIVELNSADSAALVSVRGIGA
ncbi:MAG: helix-hairpin-helix domain-containing protein, partial [Alistipes sp.]|nr:helix-hairpin-helix domain-containing protein [Alistipes sp.]